MRSAWTLSPRWAHTLGFRGHFLTKARRYSVTFAALRGVRAEYRAQADPWLTQIRAKAIGDQVVIRRTFHYAGSGLCPAERAVAASIRGSTTSPGRSERVGSAGRNRIWECRRAPHATGPGIGRRHERTVDAHACARATSQIRAAVVTKRRPDR